MICFSASFYYFCNIIKVSRAYGRGRKERRTMKKIVSLLLALMCGTMVWAQDGERKEINALWLRAHYSKAEYMVAMRDGTKLYTALYTPKNKKAEHPVLVNFTQSECEPYGKKVTNIWQDASLEEYLRAEYILAFQEVRGTDRSVADKANAEQQARDAYDTFVWLLRKAKKNNGNIGVWGVAEDARTALEAAASAHPALKAMSPQGIVMEGEFVAKRSAAPMLFVGGEFDAESGESLWNAYKQMTALGGDCRLVVGPWTHKAWREADCSEMELGNETTAEFYRAEIEFPFFEYYLRGAESSGASSAGAFIFFTGENCWRELIGWGFSEQSLALYLGEDGWLREDAPLANQEFTECEDVLTFTSSVLEQDITAMGCVEALLYATASQPKAELVVKIIDVADNGESEMMVRFDTISCEDLGADEPKQIALKMVDVAHTFLAGHRIKVQIQSTEGITLHHDKLHPSCIVLPM